MTSDETPQPTPHHPPPPPGFGPSFPLRWLTMLLYEAFLLPFDDSAFLDSPLSQKGLEQCAQLKARDAPNSHAD